MDSPFRIDVYDKGRNWLGRVADPVALDGSVKANALGNFQLRVASTDPNVGDLLTPGCRVGLSYLPRAERAAQLALGGSLVFPPLMSGMVRTEQGSVLPNGDVVLQIQDDWRLLQNTVAFVNPRNPLAPTTMVATDDSSWGQAWLPGGGSDAGPNGTTQGQYGYFLWPDGSANWGGLDIVYAEDAIKFLIKANLLDRLGRPVTIMPSSSRGGDAKTAGVLPLLRMGTVAEGIQSLLEWSGLMLKVIQPYGSSTIQIDVAERSEWAAQLTVASGIVQEGSWSNGAPSMTRAIVGGPGEGVARAFWAVNDATGLEDEYGDIIEVFRDATGAKMNWPTSVTDLYKIAKYFTLRPEPAPSDQANFAAYLTEAGAKGLAEGRPTAAASVRLSETESFYFGGAEGIQLGDSATIVTSAGELYTESITEAKFSLTRDRFTVEPVLGTPVDDPMQTLASAIARLAAAQRRVSASR